MSYVLVEYGDAGPSIYATYADWADVQKDFIERARKIGKRINDAEVLANDDDDMEALADGMIYSPNGELYLEIIEANDVGILDDQAKEDLKALHDNLSEQHLSTFWDTLRCVGCENEFREYLEG